VATKQGKAWAVEQESEEELAQRLPGYSWSLMRNTLQKLGLDGRQQITDVGVEDCFDWDPACPMLASWCDNIGWVPRELQIQLDRIDKLLDQLSDDPRFWSDPCIIGDPLWELVRSAAREALALMPEQPVSSDER
jgi:hypothetical protein